MKKNLIKILFIMLFLLTVSFTFVFDNNINVLAEEVTQTEEVVEPSLNIYKKNISYSSEIYIMYAVSYEGIDASTYPVKMLFFDAVQDEYTTQTAAYVAESQGSATIVGVNCQIFASNGLAAKQMTDDIYARAYVEVEGQTIYSEVVKYSVLEYYHEIKEEGVVPTSILNLLEAMINYGAAAQINFNYNTEKLANATYYKVNVENTVLPDGFTSGRFKAEEQVTLTAPLKEGYVFKNWTNANGDIVSTEATYTLTVVQDETLTANYEEEVAVTPVTLTLTKEAAYDATADTLELPSTVTFDYNNETVTENVTWDTTPFVVNQIGKQKLYGTLSNDSYKVNELSIEIDVLPYTFSLDEETNGYFIDRYYGVDENLYFPYIFNSKKILGVKNYVFQNKTNIKNVYYQGEIEDWCLLKFGDDSTPMQYANQFFILNQNNEWEEVTKIRVPDSITKIGDYQFYGFSNLVEISLPNSITSIDYWAFKECFSLEKISIPSKVISLGSKAFQDCSNLYSVTFEENSLLSIIGQYCFSGCSNLSQINLPNSLETIYRRAFAYCRNLKEINIPDNVTTIDSYLFYQSGLESIFIPNSICSMSNAFENCNNFKNVYYYGSIDDWFNISFENYTANPMYFASSFFLLNEKNEWEEVTEVTIPQNITTIGYQLVGFNNVNSITFSSNIITILSDAFDDCNFTNVYYDGTIETWCELKFNTNSDNPMSIGQHFYMKNSQNEWNELTKIIIPSTIETIGKWQFYGFENVEEIIISDGVLGIGVASFSSCSNLMSVNFPNSLTSIEAQAFMSCANLKSIVISENIEEINGNSFMYCSNLKTIYNLSDLELAIGSTDNGYVAYYAKYIHNELPREIALEKEVAYDATLDTLELPETVTFTYNEEEITQSVAWDTSTFIVNQIGEQVIYGTFNDDELYDQYNIKRGGIYFTIDVLPYTFTLDETTNEYAITKYYGTTEEEIIPAIFSNIIITSIGEWAFSNCSNLTSITIPSSVTSIERNAFYNCSSLTNVYYEGTIEDWCNISFSSNLSNPMSYADHFYMKNEEDNWYEVTEIVIPETITEIGDYQFYNFNSIETVIMDNNVTSVGREAFAYCTNLKSIEISNNVNVIGYGAFRECTSMTNINLPASITSINSNVFYNCRSLTSIKIPHGVTYIGYEAFYKCQSLIKLEMPSTIKNIDDYAFTYASSIDIYYYGTIEDWCNITFESQDSNPVKRNEFYMLNELNVWYEVVEIEIPNTITTIGSYQFSGFSRVKNIIIPNTVNSIGVGAFYYCESLTHIEIPNSVTMIQNHTFNFCKNLTSIVLPNSVTSVGFQAFNNCNSLTEVYFTGNEDEWNTVVIDSSDYYLTNATIHYNYVPSTEEE